MPTEDCWKTIDAVCFDVDSTVCQDEGLDELAAFCNVGDQVKNLTLSAMGGTMSFWEALKQRLDIVQPSELKVNDFLLYHPPKLTPGIKELVQCLRQSGISVYLVSGGLRRIIEPVADLLQLPRQNIFANSLLFDAQGIRTLKGGGEIGRKSKKSGVRP